MKNTTSRCNRSHLPELREDRDIFFSHMVTNMKDAKKTESSFTMLMW